MEYIEKIIEMGTSNVFMTVLVLAMSCKFLWELVDWFLSKAGIETKWSLKKKAMEKEIESLRKEVDEYKENRVHDREQSFEIQNKLTESQEDIKNSLAEFKSMFIKKEIEDMRWELLDFANAVMNNRDYNKEQYDHALSVYDDYEKILKANNMENGKVDISMDFVKRRYSELMEIGFRK